MPFITILQAQQHLRGDFDEADLLLKIAAAEQDAVLFIQRNVYVDQSALDAAIAIVPATLTAARAAYLANIEVALNIEDAELSDIEAQWVIDVYNEAKYEAVRTRHGIVINELIVSAMLLILGWLNEVREDGEALPRAAQDLLSAFRCYA